MNKVSHDDSEYQRIIKNMNFILEFQKTSKSGLQSALASD